MKDSWNSSLLLVDGHALIYRAYHAFPPLNDPKGRMVNAVYGFTRILLTALNRFDPKYVAVAFDHPKKTFRHADYEDYKAHREEMPDDLKPQIEIIKQVVTALNVPQFEQAGFEADDLIGTVAKKVAATTQTPVTIATGDKDLLQLVDDDITVWIPARGKFGKDIEYTSGVVKDKQGITPQQVVELKALMGDSSDNIPGVRGVGKKTALKLLEEYFTIDRLYQEVDLVTSSGQPHPLLKGALLTKLVEGKDSAYMSRQLATIDCSVEVDFSLEECRVAGYDKQVVIDLFEELNFSSLIKLLPADDFEVGIHDALL